MWTWSRDGVVRANDCIDGKHCKEVFGHVSKSPLSNGHSHNDSEAFPVYFLYYEIFIIILFCQWHGLFCTCRYVGSKSEWDAAIGVAVFYTPELYHYILRWCDFGVFPTILPKQYPRKHPTHLNWCNFTRVSSVSTRTYWIFTFLTLPFQRVIKFKFPLQRHQ